MENEDTEIISGKGDDFIIFLFSSEPKEKNTIKLELDPPNKGVQLGLHIFQELLMIFTMGLKFIYSKDNILSFQDLTDKDFEKMDKYFNSIGYTVIIEKYTLYDYLSNIKTPNYFKDKHLIDGNTLLKDIYYEIYIDKYIYRISFNFLF